MNQQQKAPARGWGSLLSGAVAGLESRLDNILADDETRAAEEAARKVRLGKATPTPTTTVEGLKADEKSGSRASSKTRANDRLAERLAKAAKGEKSRRPSSELPSRTVSPLPRASKETPRASVDDGRGGDGETGDTGDNAEADNAAAIPEPEPASSNGDGERASTEHTITSDTVADSIPPSIRPSIDSVRPSVDSIPPPSSEPIPSISLKRSPSFLESEVSRLTQTQDDNKRNYEEELHAHLERIDALHAKLEYLAKQAAATAKETAASADSGSLSKKLAEQEERNALLLEEGNKLSKNDIKQRGTITKLRTRIQEDEKSNNEYKRKLAASEEERSDLKDRLRIVEEREKAAQTRLKALSKLEVELDTTKRERDDAKRDISALKKELVEAEKKVEDADKRAQSDKLEDQIRVIAELNDDLSNARLEKRLVEDRGKAETKQLKEDAARQQEKSQLAQLELRNEIQNLESKLELLRSRTEEVTSSTTTDGQAKLLRQVETLQTQYALASENWQTLETTLNSRVAALEKERDDVVKREADVRKKAREANTKARRFEEDIESERERASTFETELNEQKAALAKLQTRLVTAETAAAEAKAEMERERKTWEREMQNKLDEERIRWRAENPALPSPNPLSATASQADYGHYLSAGSPTASFSNRKASESGIMGLFNRRGNTSGRGYSSDLPSLSTNERPPSRRTPPMGTPGHPTRTNTGDSSQFSRDASLSHLPGVNGASSTPGAPGGSIPPSMAPSIDIDGIDDRDSLSSPHRTVNELVSHSTMAAGPSVQLVERMSAAVRRLESEKAAAREEHARLLAQRDEAREEVVGMMREMDALKKDVQNKADVDKEMEELKTRYEASLEMLGEKSEEVEELRDDLAEVRKIYKEVLLQTGSGGQAVVK